MTGPGVTGDVTVKVLLVVKSSKRQGGSRPAALTPNAGWPRGARDTPIITTQGEPGVYSMRESVKFSLVGVMSDIACHQDVTDITPQASTINCM
mgnify:CR=1 FL=1